MPGLPRFEPDALMPATPFTTEADFLAAYNRRDYDSPLSPVDVAIFTLREHRLRVLLVKRNDFPHKDRWAMPGGFIDLARDDSLEAAALRKLTEKTGVATPYLEQWGAVGNAHRDPRGWSVTVVYFALIPFVEPPAGSDARWFDLDETAALPLAFDHAELLPRVLERLRSKVLYTVMPAHLIPSPFTLSDLQRAYETVLDRELEKKAFRRRLETAGVLEATGEATQEGAGRPAALYRLKPECAAFNFNRQLGG